MASLALAVRFRKSLTEIDEQWSQRDVNLISLYLNALDLAQTPTDVDFYRELTRLNLIGE